MPYLPVFSSPGNLKQIEVLRSLEGEFGVLAPIQDKWALGQLKSLPQNPPLYIDCGIFADRASAWYYAKTPVQQGERWLVEYRLAEEDVLRDYLSHYLKQCDRYSPAAVIAPDVFGEPLVSKYLAQLCFQCWQQERYPFQLIGSVQAGAILYDWQFQNVPGEFDSPPDKAIALVADLVASYRQLGFDQVALGGLLKPMPTQRCGIGFGLSNLDFERVMRQTKPDFILGGLALSRVELLKKYQVAADSSNWVWWKAEYDAKRFSNHNPFVSVLC